MDLKQQAQLELAKRELEQRHKIYQQSLYDFLLYFREKEKKIKIDKNWHLEEICNKLEKVYTWEIKRLMINMPPRSLKTDLISKAFPIRCMWKKTNQTFLSISYSSSLAEKNSSDARNMYVSDTYRRIFPRFSPLRKDQDTKKHWVNNDGWQIYAAGSDGSLTGFGADIIIIDDPIKPSEADSEVVRTKVNNNYHDTIETRLNDTSKGAIIIVMQRLHEDDLCWHLLDLEERGIGKKWDKLVIQSVAEEDEQHRKQWESFFEKRFPLEVLNTIKKTSSLKFATQYQQQPINKETQEFHQEWFRYHWQNTNVETPPWLRIFTAVDPAFKKWQHNDFTAIISAWFVNNKLYILECTRGKYSADKMLDVILYHIKKRDPEKIGIEAYQAQTLINTFLKNKMNEMWIYKDIEEIRQTWDKLTKIRKLIPLYRDWLIFHKVWMDDLENELIKFPRGRNDDMIDALQMVYDMYTLQPNNWMRSRDIDIEWDEYGNVINVNLDSNNEWL